MSSTQTTGFTKSKWFKLVWIVPVAAIVVAAVIIGANVIRSLPAVQSFMKDFPGQSELPKGAPVGFPAWLQWQHFLNAFFIVLIIRTGWQQRNEKRPAAFWTRNNKGLIKTKGSPKRISLNLWLHLSLDAFWVLNGIIFIVLLFVSGQWVRVVPTSWDVFPNAISCVIQYASFHWPTEDGWVNYNALQLIAYFVTVFIAAPLAFVTGIRMSPAWSTRWTRASKIYPLELARKVHFPVMLYFVLFVIVHVTLVLATGAIRNLNHMYAGNDGYGWVGFGIFMGSLVVMAAAWIAARPLLLRPIASLTGTVGR